MSFSIAELEKQLDSFDPCQRKAALETLRDKLAAGMIEVKPPSANVNLHYHSFFSYNYRNYSPSKIAWLAKIAGLAVAGIIDFDVLDGTEEFHEAAKLLELKVCVGIETRVFVPEFADKEINSPGEPGISYHMGYGFTSSKVPDEFEQFKNSLTETVAKRNRGLIDRVNMYLRGAELDYKKDVLPLTPSKNATERHICLAYARKAREAFNDDNVLRRFWTEKLNWQPELSDLPDGIDLLNTIRAKTMKRGGAGYVQPGAGAFPTLAQTNRFILAVGGIPTVGWLNGLSAGEKQYEKLVQIAISSGVAAMSIIPDRNYTPGVKDEKLDNLYATVELAQKYDLPIIIGTEMNSPGSSKKSIIKTLRPRISAASAHGPSIHPSIILSLPAFSLNNATAFTRSCILPPPRGSGIFISRSLVLSASRVFFSSAIGGAFWR